MNVMVWLANQQSQRGAGLRQGMCVSTGTCTGLDKVKHYLFQRGPEKGFEMIDENPRTWEKSKYAFLKPSYMNGVLVEIIDDA